MIWGKLIGALLGFKLGGPLGALAGAIIGHWLDRHVFKPSAPSPAAAAAVAAATAATAAAERQAAFSTAVVNLAAKLAKADGAVRREEVDAFKSHFSIPASQMAAIGALYDEAKRDARGYEVHARRLAETFAGDRLLLADVLDSLYDVAIADGALQPAEHLFLQRVATIFGLADRRFSDNAVEPSDSDPYAVLGVGRGAAMSQIKAAWRQLIREHHPDTLMAKGMPQEYIDLATRKMATINAAYDRIRAERGEA